MFGIYKFSKLAVKVNLNTVIILTVFTIVLAGASQAFLLKKNYLGIATLLLISPIVNGALYITWIKGTRSEKVTTVDAVALAYTKWIRLLLLNILVNLTYIVSFLLLIVPFVFVYPRLSLANYFLIDRDMKVMDAYRSSWRATKGHIIEPWSIYAVSVLIVLSAFTIIGIPFVIYFFIMYSAAFAVFYEMLRKQSKPKVSKTTHKLATKK